MNLKYTLLSVGLGTCILKYKTFIVFYISPDLSFTFSIYSHYFTISYQYLFHKLPFSPCLTITSFITYRFLSHTLPLPYLTIPLYLTHYLLCTFPLHYLYLHNYLFCILPFSSHILLIPSPYLTITSSMSYHYIICTLPLPFLYLTIFFSYLTYTFSVPYHYLLYILPFHYRYLTITFSLSYNYIIYTLPLPFLLFYHFLLIS